VKVPPGMSDAVGDPRAFGLWQERVEDLVSDQAEAWEAGRQPWILLPLTAPTRSFYLLSRDAEGQRRAREIIVSFLGPDDAIVETVPRQQCDQVLEGTDFRFASQIRRINADPERLLTLLEEALAVVAGRPSRREVSGVRHVDVLRDFRLAVANRDASSAQYLLDRLKLTGEISAENLRFLQVEFLAGVDRWREMRDLPHLASMLQARRPRLISDALLAMVWETELADDIAMGGSPIDVYAEANIAQRFADLLHLGGVPGHPAARFVVALTALAEGDRNRLDQVLATVDDAERIRLRRVLGLDDSPHAGVLEAESRVGEQELTELHSQGRYADVITEFLAHPRGEHVDIAVDSVLEIEDRDRARHVLDILDSYRTDGAIKIGRRLAYDLELLARLVEGRCSSWPEWCDRVATDARWAEAAQVLRSDSHTWPPLNELSPTDIARVADNLLEAVGLANEAQLVTVLDVWCDVASRMARFVWCLPVTQSVLQLLAELENLSEPVRVAFLSLLEAHLSGAPARGDYIDLLDLATTLWDRVASPHAVDWGISLGDVAMLHAAPDPDARAALVTAVVMRSRPLYARLGWRQQVELEGLAEEIGLPTVLLEADDVETSVWVRLNGKVVGVYSLLAGSAASLEAKVRRLCDPLRVESNDDKTATDALMALARRADYFIVDTWHAAHAATRGIDQVLPRDEQILPNGKGATGLLRALEDALARGL
jgi:hypothetical protein